MHRTLCGLRGSERGLDRCQRPRQECEELISADPEAEILDAGLIEAAQKVEHYEMAGYGSVRTWPNKNLSSLDRPASLKQRSP